MDLSNHLGAHCGPTDINGVRNPDVLIEVLKSVYKLLMIDLVCSGI